MTTKLYNVTILLIQLVLYLLHFKTEVLVDPAVFSISTSAQYDIEENYEIEENYKIEEQYNIEEGERHNYAFRQVFKSIQTDQEKNGCQ